MEKIELYHDQMRNKVVSSMEESKEAPSKGMVYKNIKPTAEMEDYEYEEEGKVITLKYPKNVPVTKIKRTTYKYKKIAI